jgi:GxxExxY protein
MRHDDIRPPWQTTEDDPLTRSIIAAAIEVHRELGPGLLEGIYEECLCHELNKRGLAYRRQVELPIVYKGISLRCQYRLDLIVAEEVIAENKCVESLLPVHEAQLLTYLRLSRIRTGLLINFNVAVLTRGIKRMKL